MKELMRARTQPRVHWKARIHTRSQSTSCAKAVRNNRNYTTNGDSGHIRKGGISITEFSYEHHTCEVRHCASIINHVS